MNDDSRADKDFPASFHFNEPGDSVTGKLVRWDRGPSKFGDEQIPIAVLETEAGPRGVWLFSAVLKAKFGELKPKAGEVVRVEFLGTKKSATSEFSYKNWSVSAPEREAEEYVPDFADWAADSTYQGEVPPVGDSPWA